MSKKLSYEEVRIILKEYLPIFLKEEGLPHSNPDADGKINFFKSIWNKYDSNPSLHIMYKGKAAYGSTCFYDFSENKGGDIFVAHSVLKNAPALGYEFITENVKVLADRYGLNYCPLPMTEEQIKLMNLKRIYSMVKDDIVLNFKHAKLSKEVEAYIDDKNINRKTDSITYSIGYVPSWDEFKKSLTSQGITTKELEELDIVEYKFNSNNLIFCGSDSYGNVTSFSSRNCIFNKKNNSGHKYYNTCNNAIFDKSKMLYNLNRALHVNPGRYASLYITEGATDAIDMDKAGLKAASLWGTAFCNNHIGLLQKHGESDIVLILDGDAAGRKATVRAAVEVMKGIRSFRTRIVQLPEGYDPSLFLKEHGRDKLLSLPHVSLFEWHLDSIKEKTDLSGYEIAEEAVPLIVNETSAIERDRMCSVLSEITKVDIMAIRKEVENLASNEQMAFKREIDAAVDNIVKELRGNPEEAQFILANASETLNEISSRRNLNLYDSKEYIKNLDDIKIYGESLDERDSISIYGMPRLERSIDGELKGKLAFIGGDPNTGKTAFCISYAINMLKGGMANPDYNQKADKDKVNDISIIYHTVDGERGEVLPKFVSAIAASFYPETTINKMYAPGKYGRSDTEELYTARNKAFSILRKWGNEDRLIIKDSSSGSTLSSVLQMIRSVKQKHPERLIIFIGDNFYNYTDYANFEETEGVKRRCNDLKLQILEKEKVFGLFTVEYKKNGGEGKKTNGSLNERVRGSKSLEFRANFMGHLLNELHFNEESDMYIWNPSVAIDKRKWGQDKLPIVTLSIGKNKLTAFKGNLHYLFDSNKALHLEMNSKILSQAPLSLRERIGKLYTSDSSIEESYG